MVRALPNHTEPSVVFRDAACAILRLSRARGRAECDALGVVFEEADSDDRRVIVLDLLASAGTPEAQIVLRRLLSLGVARRNSRTFAMFVQRLGFVERPDGGTLRYLIGVYAESRHEPHEVRAACAYALGAAAGRAHVWGLVDPALRASEVLRRDLRTASSPTEKCSILTALGNAGLDGDVPIILRFVEDPESRVRCAAALALRKMDTREARASLLSMIAGSDLMVAESALSALFGQSLSHSEIVALAELVLAGRTAVALDSRILRLIVTQKLSTMAPPVDVVEEVIHLLLRRLESPPVRIEGERRVEPLAVATAPKRTSLDGRHLRAVPSEPFDSPLIAVPKTPLPFSAGYRMVKSEAKDDAVRLAQAARRPQAVAQPQQRARSVQPVVHPRQAARDVRSVAHPHPQLEVAARREPAVAKAEPQRQRAAQPNVPPRLGADAAMTMLQGGSGVLGVLARTMMQGGAWPEAQAPKSGALRPSAPVSKGAAASAVPKTGDRGSPPDASARPSSVAAEQNLRSRSAVSVAVPVRPIAIVR